MRARIACIATVVAVLLAPPAFGDSEKGEKGSAPAHTIDPSAVRAGSTSTVTAVMPAPSGGQAGHGEMKAADAGSGGRVTTGVKISLPAGFELVGCETKPGWSCTATASAGSEFGKDDKDQKPSGMRAMDHPGGAPSDKATVVSWSRNGSESEDDGRFTFTIRAPEQADRYMLAGEHAYSDGAVSTFEAPLEVERSFRSGRAAPDE